MLRIVGVGDNTIDMYKNLRMMFPGGNALNVSVFAHRYGHSSSYIGRVGNDERGAMILDALRAEGVDISHIQVKTGPTAFAEVTHTNGERIFGTCLSGVSAEIQLDEEDFDFIKKHDVVHTSVYSHIEKHLRQLRASAKHLSIDLSENLDKKHMQTYLPFVDMVFVSATSLSSREIAKLIRWITAQGPQIVVATRGRHGTIASDGHATHSQKLVPRTVVDTLGAGDAFAARFLVEYFSGTCIKTAIQRAAVSAARKCAWHGAFGHGKSY
jgi:fructoselysine 6-kinase